MGIRGLYSCIKCYAVPIHPESEEPLVIGIDTYALFYKYKENLTELFTFAKLLTFAKTTCAVQINFLNPRVEYKLMRDIV
jgi:hypothetical protein